MRVLIMEPDKKPRIQEIDGSLRSMQEIVGGTIEAVYPWDEPVALICNDEAKLVGLPLNRALVDEDSGQIRDIIAGTFFLCGLPPDSENFGSLTEPQLTVCQKRFASPETFLQLGGQLIILREPLA